MATASLLTVSMGPITIDHPKMKRKADRAVDWATKKQLIFLRTRARTRVLRRRKRPSAPGSPPSIHSRDSYATLRNIRWVYEGDGVGQVGAVKLNQVNLTVEKGSQPVPSILEHGGTIKLREQRFKRGGKWRRRDGRMRKRPDVYDYRTRLVRIRPRPYMSEALRQEIEAGTIMDPYANVIGE